MTRALTIIPWLLLAAILIETFSPFGAGFHFISDGVLERFLEFAVCGAVLGAGYRRHFGWALALAAVATALLQVAAFNAEGAQMTISMIMLYCLSIVISAGFMHVVAAVLTSPQSTSTADSTH